MAAPHWILQLPRVISRWFKRLLAASPALINASDNNGRTALHRAALNGHLPVVAHLLAAKPELTDAVDTCFGWTALHFAAASGSIPIAELFLAASPTLIKAADNVGHTALHVAASRGDCTMVEYLLSVSPALVGAVDQKGSIALHHAACAVPRSILPVARALLAIKPDLISVTNNDGHTMLHHLVQYCEAKEVLEEMWRLYPEALRVVGKVENDTPFHVAVDQENFVVIEMFQWQLTWEEIKSAYASCNDDISSCKDRFRPVLETQCESLSLWLLPEVIGTVFEYLDFNARKKKVEASPFLSLPPEGFKLSV